MALQLRSQAALCSPKVCDLVRAQAKLQWRCKMPKYSVALDGKPTNKLLLGTRKLSKSLIDESNLIDFKSISKRSSKTIVFASISASPASVCIASTLFTFGSAFVVPFYTAIIVAPQAKWTKKLIESSFPYVVLGALYVYLLALSWSPETLQLMFASKYWLPELPGITRMFSSTLTVASAWIHLLAVDLFAGRQIYLDGLEHGIETRHSLVLCLIFCPVGMLSHFITKAMVRLWRKGNNEEISDVAKLYS